MKCSFSVIILAGLLVTFFVSNAMSQQEDALIGYWSFEDGKGDTVKDQSGKGNDGEMKGNVAVTASREKLATTWASLKSQ